MMFYDSSSIGAALLGSLFGVFLLPPTERWPRVNLYLQVAILLAGLYALACGVDMLTGWTDPLAEADPEKLAHASARARGRGGLLILAIRYWPWALIGLGGFVAWNIGGAVYYTVTTSVKR